MKACFSFFYDVATLRSKVARLEAEAEHFKRRYGLHKKVAKLEAEIAQLRLESSSHWGAVQLSARRLTDVEYHFPEPHSSSDTQRFWEAWCPCCKKPLDLVSWRTPEHQPADEKPQKSKSPQYAYVATLWGNGDGAGLSGFILGALVLGFSLKKLSDYERVLMYTDEVPQRFLLDLQKLWKLVRVDRIDAHKDLFTGDFEGHRFNGVFTKLHALTLVQYEKVILLDIDLVIFDCPDELFDLKAPAAMRRGPRESEHGERMHTRGWFGGQKEGWWQLGGINGGLLLLKPNMKDFEQMRTEVSASHHPERVAGNGPEQDYLSRYYASEWHHISVVYNFQLHQVFFSLESSLQWFADLTSRDSASTTHAQSFELWTPERLALDLGDIKIVHMSGDMKPWDRDFLNPEDDEAFAQYLLMQNCDWHGKLWLERAGSNSEYAEYGIYLQDEMFQALGDRGTGLAQDPGKNSIDDFISKRVNITKTIAVEAVAVWRQILIALPDVLGYASLSKFLDKFEKKPIFFPGEKVSVRWYADRQQYEGILTEFERDGWHWVQFFGEEGAWIVRQDLNPISSASTNLGSQCSTTVVQL